MGSDPLVEVVSADNGHCGLHERVVKPAQLSTAHIERTQLRWRGDGRCHDPGVCVDLDTHLGQPERVNNVGAGDLEDDCSVDREHEVGATDSAVIVIREGPEPLLTSDLHDKRRRSRRDCGGSCEFGQAPDQQEGREDSTDNHPGHGQTCI